MLGIFDDILFFSDLKFHEILRIQNWVLDSQSAETSHAVLGGKLGIFTSKEVFCFKKAETQGQFFPARFDRTVSLSFSPSWAKKILFWRKHAHLSAKYGILCFHGVQYRLDLEQDGMARFRRCLNKIKFSAPKLIFKNHSEMMSYPQTYSKIVKIERG